MYLSLLVVILLLAVASYLSAPIEKAVRCLAYAAVAVYVLRALVG